ncbi:MAG: DUF6503 family protein [Fulvivirga sp.]|nr:DUF6503 family protein [Fulvivirga sp.]
MKNILIISLFVALFSCNADEKESAQEIVNRSIEVAGGDHLNNVDIEFEFRGREYGAKFENGHFEYVRLFKDSADLVRDELTNEGFVREINGEVANIPDSMAAKYARSVNGVIYFALLPQKLSDPAVNTSYMGEKEINEQKYHKIKVTFDKQQGGEDHNDVFIYWINQQTYKPDFLAYEYHTDGGGMRFREAYNERYVGYIRFVDYINYKPVANVTLENIDEAYINDELEKLSSIELEKIKVNTINQ